MKVISKKAFRARNLLVLAPLALIVMFLLATSGPISVGAAFAPSASIPPPGPFPPAPLGIADPDCPAPGCQALAPYYDGYYTADELINGANTGVLQNGVNEGNVHLLDVRSSFEVVADVCPMQIALMMPVYPETNTGHPIWKWPSGTYEEAYTDNYWIGFYFAGSTIMDNMTLVPEGPMHAAPNIRMEENPNFHDYMGALLAAGELDLGDELVVVCQTGYRASFAAMEIEAMDLDSVTPGQQTFASVKVLYGGMLAWSDDWYLDDTSSCDNNPSPTGWPLTPGNSPQSPGPGQDPSPDDYDPDYMTSAGGFGYPDDVWNGAPPDLPNGVYTGANCDPDNQPGPAFNSSNANLLDGLRHKSNVLAAPWAYDTARLALVGAPTIWDGLEPHVAVKPEWMGAMGIGDFNLSLLGLGSSYASMADFGMNRVMVKYGVTNNAPLDVTPSSWAPDLNPDNFTGGNQWSGPLPFPYVMNYQGINGSSPCGGVPASAGGGCANVYQPPHGTAYMATIMEAKAPSLASPEGLACADPPFCTSWVNVDPTTAPAFVGDIAANTTGIVYIKYDAGALPSGSVFVTNLHAMATDVPGPYSSPASPTWTGVYNDLFHTPLMSPIFAPLFEDMMGMLPGSLGGTTMSLPLPFQGMGWYGVYMYPGPPF